MRNLILFEDDDRVQFDCPKCMTERTGLVFGIDINDPDQFYHVNCESCDLDSWHSLWGGVKAPRLVIKGT